MHSPAQSASADSRPLTVAYPALPKPMTVGDASVEYRPSVAPGESTVGRLTLAGAAELSALKTQPVTHSSPSDPGFVYKLSPQIDLYPWMWAELQVAPAAFTLAPSGCQRKPVLPGRPNGSGHSCRYRVAGART